MIDKRCARRVGVLAAACLLPAHAIAAPPLLSCDSRESGPRLVCEGTTCIRVPRNELCALLRSELPLPRPRTLLKEDLERGRQQLERLIERLR